MIETICPWCGNAAEFDDGNAGRTEACPACGALIDVPLEPPTVPIMADLCALGEAGVAAATLKRRSIRRFGPLWWTCILALLAIFIAGLFWLSRDSWEQTHLQNLADQSKRAEANFFAGKFSDAIDQYQQILAIMGNRHFQSRYLQSLRNATSARLEQARHAAKIQHAVDRGDADAARGEIPDAIKNYQAAIFLGTSAAPGEDEAIALLLARARGGIASAQAAIADKAAAVAAQKRDADLDRAVSNFKRAADGFADFASHHPTVFQDALGQFRHRAFVIWNVSANTQPSSDPHTPPIITLEYRAISHTTAPHANSAQAAADQDYRIEDPDAFTYHRATFALIDGIWQRQSRSRGDGHQWLDAHNPQFLPHDSTGTTGHFDDTLATLENQAFSPPASSLP